MHKLGVAIIVTGLLLVSAIFCAGAFANTSTARLGAGGLVITKTQDIRLLEEVLEISTKVIRAKFCFRNESDKDIHTTVAFPIAPYPWVRFGSETDDKYPGFVVASFKVWVDGRSISPEVVRKAVIGNSDVTGQLRELGLSDEEIFEPHKSHAASEPNKSDVTDAPFYKLVWGKEQQIDDLEVTETMFWEQTFVGGKETVVELSYKPVAGTDYGCFFDKDSGYLSPDGQKTYSYLPLHEWITDWERNHGKACLDQRTSLAIAEKIADLLAKGSDFVDFNITDIEYILSTGRNWKGPIGAFTLRIEKETPDEIVSLCFPGKARKVSPTIYEFYKRDFVPPDKLVVYFYRLHPGSYRTEPVK